MLVKNVVMGMSGIPVRPISLPAHRVGVVILEQEVFVDRVLQEQLERGKQDVLRKHVHVKNVNRGQVVGIALLANRGHIVRADGLFTAVLVRMVIRDYQINMEQQALRKPAIVVVMGKNLMLLITMLDV